MVLYSGAICYAENFIEEQNVSIVMIYYNISDIITYAMPSTFDLYSKGYIAFLHRFSQRWITLLEPWNTEANFLSLKIKHLPFWATPLFQDIIRDCNFPPPT